MESSITINVRGFMGSLAKRLKTYGLCRKRKAIGMLQETHTLESDESKIRSEWEGEIICSHGTSKSAGVIILIPPNVSVENIFKDESGRIVACFVPSLNITLCNIYSPCHDKRRDQKLFYKDLIGYTKNLPNLVLGGDKNLIFDALLDRQSKTKYVKTEADYLVEEWLLERQLIDIWRVRNPELRRFTWRQRTRGGLVQSRLDNWLIDINLQFSVKSCEILTSTILP